MLSALPVKEYQAIGQYYAGWSAHLQGRDTRHIFEQVLEDSTTYKARALIGLAAVEAKKGDSESELKYFVEAAKSTSVLSAKLDALRGVAIVKAKEDHHKQSLSDLEGLLPFACYMDSKAYLAYLNSFAVELGEAGRVEEARNVINIVLASPFAFAYPEWRETSEDIALRGYKSRSVISFDAWNIANNVLYLSECSQEESTQTQPGTVSTLEDWKKKMVKEPNGEDELPENMTRQDMAMKILEMITEHKDDDEKLRKLLEYAAELFKK